MTKPSSSESNKLSLDHRPESHRHPAKKPKVDDGDHTDDDEVGTATDRSMSQNPRIQRYLVAVEYIGTRFYGAQQQSDRRTVVGALQEAFHKFIGQPVSIFCSSRTKNEGDIAVIDVRCVAPDFHSRYKALERTYFYRLLSGPEPLSSFEKDRAWHVPEELDLPAMQKACKVLVGHHDFSSFRAAGCEVVIPFLDRAFLSFLLSTIICSLELDYIVLRCS
ncbi:hypothetical protein RJ639_011915 [Escallonia herrerae]|uniref:tRNA pseudouridine synthase n=1 Tax=Escallonia herrerae TaxID=1293975 RepID=A0AA89AT77_9ASTE|nr:hypothetical protein RJ639_011915 [Escallonia herrerae]